MKPKSRNPFLSAPRLSLPFASAIAAMTVLAATPAARAATWNKLVAGPFSWNDDANWGTPATFVNAVGDTALMTGNLSANQTINLNQSITLGSFTVGDNSGAQTTLLQKGTSGALIFDQTASGDALLTRTATGTGTVTFASDLTMLLNDNLVISLASGAASSSMVINGIISSASGKGITKNSSTLSLTLAGNNDYTGLTTVGGGELLITHANALGGTTNGTTVTAGSLTVGGGITTNSSESITITGVGFNNFGALRAGTGGGTWAGTVNLNGTTTRIGATAGNTLNITGSIVDGTGNTFAVSGESGTGVVVLNPTTSNTYAGNTGIIRGILRLGKTDALPTGTTLDVDSVASVTDAATFDMAGFNQTVAALQDTATDTNAKVTNIGGAVGTSTLTVNQSAATNFGGTIENGAVDRLVALTKSGTGVLTLSGTNTHTGGTTISNGALSITTTGALPGFSTNGSYSVANGATLAVYNAVTNANITSMLGTTNFAAGASLGFDTTTANRTYSVVLTNTAQGALGLTKLGANSLIIDQANNYTGVTTVSGGILNIQHANALGATSGNTVVASGGTLFMGTASLSIAEALNLTGNGSTGTNGALNFGGGVTGMAVTGAITLGGAARIQGDGGTGATLSGGIDLGANALTYNTDGGATHTISTVKITGTGGSLTKSGTGTLSLRIANDYTGVTTVSGGILNIQHADALGATSGNTSVDNGATLQLQGGIPFAAEPLTMAAGNSATARLENVSGNNTWNGPITITGSSNLVRVGSTADLLTLAGDISVTSGVQFVLQGASAIEVTGKITGAGIVTSSSTGAGIRTLSNAANDYTGATNVNGGTLVGIGANAFGSTTGIAVLGTLSLRGDTSTGFVKASDSAAYSVTTAASGATINADRATVAGTAAKTMTIGTLGLFNTATNNTNFTGANNTSLSIGAVTTAAAASGTETLTNSISGGGSLTLASIAVNRTGTPTLAFAGDGNTTVSGAITQAATTTLTKNGTGTLTLGGTSTYTGATLVSAGTLLVNGELGNTAVTVNPTATIGGSGVIGGSLHFDSGSMLTVNLADPLSITGSVTFAGFGFANLTNFDVETVLEGTYTLLAGTGFNLANVSNVDFVNAYTRIDGKKAYFQNGSLQVVVIPEPSTALLGGLGLLALLRRRR